MLNVRQILVSASGLVLVGVALTACGQRGPLYLPTDPAAKGRATLPSLLVPDSTGSTGSTGADAAAPAPAAASSAPSSGAAR